MTGRNIGIVLGGLADAVRSQNPEPIAALLDPDVVWEGVEPGLRCDGRDQALNLIRNRFAAGPLDVRAVEVIDAGEQVVVGLSGPGFNAIPGDRETPGHMYSVFTLREGKVIRWRTYRSRDDALAAAGH